MEITEIIPGQSYATAVELPNKRRRWVNGTQKSSPSGNSGAGKPARTLSASARGMFADQQKLDRNITETHRRRLVIYNGKRRWIAESDYQAGTWREK